MPHAAPLLVDRLAWDRRAGDASFALAAGEILFVCGEGAVSLLLTLAGFAPIRGGRILSEGRDLATLPAAGRHAAYIPGGDSLLPRRSLLANAMLAGADRAAAAAALARLDLAEAMHRPAAAASMQARRLAALARALAAQPALLLIEEAADDPRAIPDRLHELAPLPSVVATGCAALALARADRILLLRDGRPVQLASPRDLYQRPADRFAATWAGTCNLLSVILDGAGPVSGSVRARFAGHPVAARFRDQASGPAILAIRPQAIRLDPLGLAATVSAIDYLGPTTRLTLLAGETPVQVDMSRSETPRAGSVVGLSWDWADAWPLPA